MKKHTVSLTTAKKLKKLGWEKETLFVWGMSTPPRNRIIVFNEDEDSLCDEKEHKHNWISAPIASELLEELPWRVTWIDDTGEEPITLVEYLRINKEKGTTKIIYENRKDGGYLKEIFAPTPAEALALMWIYLKENNLIK